MRIYANGCISDSHAQNVFIHAMRKYPSLFFAPIPLFLSIFIFSFYSLLFLHFPLPLPCSFSFSLSLSLLSSYLLLVLFSFLIFWTFTKTRTFVLYLYKNIETQIALHLFIVLFNDAFSFKQASKFYYDMKIALSLINSEYNNKCTYILPYLLYLFT